MRASTVKGTRDFLPREAELRDFMQRKILETYRSAGFSQIITPALEDVDNLANSEGGDNLNLMFKVLKRGDKLSAAIAGGQRDSLADMGLRYDLTLPLCRYVANNRAKLISPLKCIQMGNAYRAENPQRGRYREFMQCDIDIVGAPSRWAEIELITVTGEALLNLGVGDFRIRVNDRRILSALFLALGFSQSQLAGVCIAFDKLDKIGVQGVERELRERNFPEGVVSRLLAYLRGRDYSLAGAVRAIGASEHTRDLEGIIEAVNQLAEGRYRCEFDLSLVRGQGYYTGAVFEAESLAYRGSLAGGGRYDNLIGKFTGETLPAVGFSIGFERIFDLLLGRKFSAVGGKQKIALLFSESYCAAHGLARDLRKTYDVSIYERPQKLGKFLDSLQREGYAGFCTAEQPEVRVFKKAEQ